MFSDDSGSTNMFSLKSDDLHRIFEQLDRDGDRYVSVEELNWLLDRLGIQTSPDELENIVGRRNLDLSEFILFYESISNQEKDQSTDGDDDDDESDLVAAFKVFDLNADGFISSEELQCVLSSLGLWEERSGADCASMITKFDTNSDGLLDYEEFKNMMLLTSP